MEVSYFINLIFIFALNVLFFFSGICLNSLVILSFWRSVQLRKKLCHFMIMVLSCCDLLAVSTNHPFLALVATLWLTKEFNNVYPRWMNICLFMANILLGLSLLTLLVMNFERYLATCYPIFHRTSVTKGKLLTLLGTLIVVELSLYLINYFFISYSVGLLVFLITISPPMLFINYKLFKIARKSRRNNGISPGIRKTFSWKNISSCLLAVVCFVALAIPGFVYSGLRTESKNEKRNFDNIFIAGLWASTIISMNSTFNCLIFYWKNKILRTEGMKVIKSIKNRRNVQS